MKTFDVQSIEINAPFEKTFDYIAEAKNLPLRSEAFISVGDGKAELKTPHGSAEIALRTEASCRKGTIDWVMTFPDGSAATAYSRVVSIGSQKSIYSAITCNLQETFYVVLVNCK